MSEPDQRMHPDGKAKGIRRTMRASRRVAPGPYGVSAHSLVQRSCPEVKQSVDTRADTARLARFVQRNALERSQRSHRTISDTIRTNIGSKLSHALRLSGMVQRSGYLTFFKYPDG